MVVNGNRIPQDHLWTSWTVGLCCHPSKRGRLTACCVHVRKYPPRTAHVGNTDVGPPRTAEPGGVLNRISEARKSPARSIGRSESETFPFRAPRGLAT